MAAVAAFSRSVGQVPGRSPGSLRHLLVQVSAEGPRGMAPQRLEFEGHLAFRLGLPLAGVHAADGLRLVAVLRAYLQSVPRMGISSPGSMKEESDYKRNSEPASKSLQCLSVVDLAAGGSAQCRVHARPAVTPGDKKEAAGIGVF